MNNKKILVVDDSALMRKLLREIFEKEGFEVATARNGKEAIEMNNSFQPDVITLDINMPEMDGLTALSHIMLQRPVPVVMVSSLTEEGAIATFEALNLGAVDYVTKPGGTISLNIDQIKDEACRFSPSSGCCPAHASNIYKVLCRTTQLHLQSECGGSFKASAC